MKYNGFIGFYEEKESVMKEKLEKIRQAALERIADSDALETLK